MKIELLETEKNFLVCAILMIIVGIVMCFTNMLNLGIITIVIGIVFLIIVINMIRKRKSTSDKENVDKQKK